MGDMTFVAGYVLVTLVPALAAGRLVLLWRRGTMGAVLAVTAGLVAAWLGLGLFVRVALGPGLVVPMMD